VDEAEVAQDVPEVADLSLVEVREVDAGAEEPLAGVAWMLDFAAAQHADFALRIEQRDIDRSLERPQRRLVFRIQEPRVLHRHDGGLTHALDARAAQIELAGALELRRALARLG